jgi:hypothetical protein
MQSKLEPDKRRQRRHAPHKPIKLISILECELIDGGVDGCVDELRAACRDP